MCLITSNKGNDDTPPPRRVMYREQGSGVFYSEPAPIEPRRSYAASSRSAGARSRSSIREVREVRQIAYPPVSPRASHVSSARESQPVVVLPAGTRTVRTYYQ